jgi:hypothetical protein
MKISILRAALFVSISALLSHSLALGARSHPIRLQNEKDSTQEQVLDFGRPDPEGVPTKVYVGYYLIDLISIDDVNQSFEADFYVMARWNDPRLAITNPSEVQTLRNFDINEIWHPQTYIINQRRLSRQFENFFRVDQAGNALYVQRLIGELSSPLYLKDFPFDKQKLKVQMVSFRYGPEEIEFVLDQQRIGRREQLSLTGWSTGPTQFELTTEYLKVQDRDLARVDFILEVERQEIFYIVKALIPLFLIIFMAWAVFFIDPSVIGPQIGIPTSSVFALILFNHRISALLPRVSYLTRLDRFILLSIILVFITLGESVLTATLAHKEKKDLALKIDRWSRYVYLILLGCVIVYSFFL